MDITSKDRILVTGATGMLGRHLLPKLTARYPSTTIIPVGSRDADLTSADQTAALFRDVKPDGQLKKIFDVSRLSALGLRCETPLKEGLRKTVLWFQTHYSTPGAIQL